MIIILLFCAFEVLKVSANLGADNGLFPPRTDVNVSDVISNEKPTFLYSSKKNSDGTENGAVTVTGVDDNCFVSKDGESTYLIVDLQGQFKVSHVTWTNIHRKRQVSIVIELMSVCENVTHVCGTVDDAPKDYKMSCDNQVAEKVRIKTVKEIQMKLCIIEVHGVAFQEITTTRIPTTTRMPTTAPPVNVQIIPQNVENVYNQHLAKHGVCKREDSDTVVDLAGTFMIDNVVLKSSPNCLIENNPSAAVELYSVCGSWSHVCGKLGQPTSISVDEPKATYNISCDKKMGTKVRINVSKDQNMKICDIDVYGEKIK